jgi:hypothetical protein
MSDPGAIAARGGVTTVLGLVATLAALPRAASAQAAADPPSAAFACMGEAEAFVRDHDLAEIRAERDRRLGTPTEPGEAAAAAAYRWCVIAELMRVLGDDRTAAYYARAIDATADPGYELLFAGYLRNTRGPGAPLVEQARRHYSAALDGTQRRMAAAEGDDATIADWATRGLMLTYQRDGLPLTPWSGDLHDRSRSRWPSLAVMAGARVAVDTNDTPLDMTVLPEVDDARRFTAEAMFASSMFRTARPLSESELRTIARAPRRDEMMVRGRLRASPIGALDVWFRQSDVHDGAITNFNLPTVMNNVTTSEFGAGVTRALDLYPAFDVLLAGSYHRVHRVGAVEFFPDQAQDFNQLDARATAVRYLGPDQLSLSGGYAVMAIPDASGGVIEDRARGRRIAAIDAGYAVNRLALAPLRLPALRVTAGVAEDDEAFGVRVIRRRDAHLGLALVRLQGWDVTVQSSVLSSTVDARQPDPSRYSGEDPQQSNAQYRTTLTLLRRLIDEDAEPGMPAQVLGMRPSMVNVVVSVRHDVRLAGLHAFQNVRAGVELWSKAFVTPLRGTAFLVSAGYENQYFYMIGKDLHILHGDVRMGW